MAENNTSIQVSLNAIETVRAGVLKRMQDVFCAMADAEEPGMRDWKYKLGPMFDHLEQLDEYEAALRNQLVPRAGFVGFGGVGRGRGRGRIEGTATWRRLDERGVPVPMPTAGEVEAAKRNTRANDWSHPDHVCPAAGTPEVMSEHMRMCCKGRGFSFPKR